MKSIATTMILTGGVLLVLGLLMFFAARLPFPFGRLPGDIHVHGRNTTFHFPVVTCIVVSVVLTLILNLLMRIVNR
ncbi:DUF2905 domain-containing protein [Kiritimatiella glycovorans]|uniref:DUF2905 domain-containing protein n=1 Tax=Kiritimatiella glycovorans TaxID=1307763 RepID=A0A0G3EHA3_9BACT|nr:DUF2905 domain-containing protein [Kiritimatiella glycovorans]AKJ63534.1 hypothetical protein L21SP4_00251 [Kiritimatiella glycovorans]